MFQGNPYPLAEAVADGRQLQTILVDAVTALERAIEQRTAASAAYRDAKASYESAETEYVFDIVFGDHPDYARAKNADMRKLAQDKLLISARDSGYLASAWRALGAAESRWQQAEAFHVQAEARFRAARGAAELQSSMLRAATAV